jgi:hypothetical protein
MVTINLNFMRQLILTIVVFFFSFNSYSQISTFFYQKDKTKITINLNGNFENIEIRTSKNNKVQVLDSIEVSITGNKTEISIEDYNFDGFKDFACYYLDDGMGVYRIYQIFIYNPKTNRFNELKIAAKENISCDFLCDIEIDKKRKILKSSCRGGARWHSDYFKFNTKGELIVFKKE